MRRVVLTHLPGLNYFIGTFDLTNYQVWWKSTPLPGAIQTIEHALWVGGPMHLCLAKMLDGTWSIFLSSDYGVNWQLVKNSAVEIMDIELVTFTWVLYSDANGDWWESTNSGLDWAKVCTSGPVGLAFFVLHKGDNVMVFAHDGRYVKKSNNIARTWTTACDLNQVVIDADDYREAPIYYTGRRVAAIAGANGTILASNGPWVARSMDNGDEFTCNHSWDTVYAGGGADQVLDFETNEIHSCFPPIELVELGRNDFLIKDIVISSIDGPLGGDVAFVLLTEDLNGRYVGTKYKRIVVNDIPLPVSKAPTTYPISEEFNFPLYIPGSNDDYLRVDVIEHVSDLDIIHSGTKHESVTLYSYSDWASYTKSIYVKYDQYDPPMNRVFKTFSGRVISGSLAGDEYYNFWFKYVYQQAVSMGMLELSSYQLLTPGGTSWDRLLFSAMRSADDQGNPIISLKYSTDGGLTYHQIDLSQIEVYSGNVDEGPDIGGGAFTYLDYSNVVWISGQCNNTGHWDYETGEKIQMLSYDMDMIVTADRAKTYTLDARIPYNGQKPYTVDMIASSVRPYSYYLSAYAQTVRARLYRLDAEVQKIKSGDYDIGAAICVGRDVTYDIDARLSAAQRLQFYLYAAIQGPKSMGYTLDALITDSQADEMLVSFERRIQQLWNLITKPLPRQGGVYDSRIDPETD
jgi:hypothetical protein